MTELLRLLSGSYLSPEQETKRAFYKGAIPKVAAAGEAYLNPSSILRTLSQPAKRDLIAALSKAIGHSSKATSAFKMAYGKRRNYRSKRSYGRGPKGRKRTYGRRRKASSNTLLSSIKQALKNGSY